MSELDPASRSAVVPPGITLRQALPSDAAAIHALLRPYVAQRLLLDRTEAELIELTRHGFIAEQPAGDEAERRCIGFSAIEIYSPKLAELQCLAVHHEFRRTGIGRQLVAACIERARGLGVMEILAISSSEDFLKSCGFDYSLPDQKKALFCQLRPRHPE
jgi:amino-acid N-acetyltransferase